MIALSQGAQVWLCAGYTDMRKSFDGLGMIVQQALKRNPFRVGDVFIFRGKRGDRIKVLWFDGTGLCLLTKRLEEGHFVWPVAQSGSVQLSAGQLGILLEGIDWRQSRRAATPVAMG
jgi:transposase